MIDFVRQPTAERIGAALAATISNSLFFDVEADSKCIRSSKEEALRIVFCETLRLMCASPKPEVKIDTELYLPDEAGHGHILLSCDNDQTGLLVEFKRHRYQVAGEKLYSSKGFNTTLDATIAQAKRHDTTLQSRFAKFNSYVVIIVGNRIVVVNANNAKERFEVAFGVTNVNTR